MSKQSITAEELSQIEVAFGTPSMGAHPSHTVEQKMLALKEAGYKNFVMGFGNFVTYVRSKRPDLPASTCPELYIRDGEPDPSDDILWDALNEEAVKVNDYAASLGMRIAVLQPFGQYEGWPAGSERGEWVKGKAKRWVKLAGLLGAEFLQLGSNDQEDANAPESKIQEDVRWLADLGMNATPRVKISYEPWSFSPRKPDWEGCWETVKALNHPNLGLCIDTSHVALTPNHGFLVETGEGYTEEQFQGALERIRNLPADKIHYYEICEVIEPNPPLNGGSAFDAAFKEEGADPRPIFHWNMYGRTIPYVGSDAGQDVHSAKDLGAARCAEITKAVFDTGFRGLCSWEVFEMQYMKKEDPSVPARYAAACKLSQERLWKVILELGNK